jgi:hypothetical protein
MDYWRRRGGEVKVLETSRIEVEVAAWTFELRMGDKAYNFETAACLQAHLCCIEIAGSGSRGLLGQVV